MRGRRPRPLSQEDRVLWNHVARHTQPLHGRHRPKPEEDAASEPAGPAGPEPAPSPPMRIQPFQIGARASGGVDLHNSASTPLAAEPLRMDRKMFTRMKAGKLDPEARIDLHGMSLAQAHPALTGFILRSQAAGRRLVLVITGKGVGDDGGGPIPERRGVLKRQVPHWLRQPPLAGAVLQIVPAHRRHGGEGAIYVYLRRPRDRS